MPEEADPRRFTIVNVSYSFTFIPGPSALLLLTFDLLSLGLNTLLSSLASSLGLRSLGVHFFLESTLTLLLSLGLVDLKNISNLNVDQLSVN
jgi:hypothetical protein